MAGESLFGDASVWDSSRGEFINQNHRRVAEVLADYDENLRLLYIPPAERTESDVFPFAVGYVRPGAEPEIVFFCGENEVNETLLARVFAGDHRKHDVLLMLEKEEAARKILETKARLEKMEEGREIAEWMIRTPLNRIQLGKGQVLNT